MPYIIVSVVNRLDCMPVAASGRGRPQLKGALQGIPHGGRNRRLLPEQGAEGGRLRLVQSVAFS